MEEFTFFSTNLENEYISPIYEQGKNFIILGYTFLPIIVIITLIVFIIKKIGLSFNYFLINKKLKLLEKKTNYIKFMEMEETFKKTKRLLQIGSEIRKLNEEIIILKK